MMSFRITLALICGCFVAATEVDGQVTAPNTNRGHHRRPVVTADSVTPASGNGISQTFILRYSDSAGFDDLATTWVWFKTPLRPRANSCLVYYDRAAFTVSLLDDTGTEWQSSTVPNNGRLENSQCSIQLETTVVGGTATSLMWYLSVVFKPEFGGDKNINMYAASVTGAHSRWQRRGTWTVGGSIVVTADSVSPSSGSGSTQTFTLRYSDTAGYADLATLSAWFNGTFASTAANSCLVSYDRATRLLSLLDDGGTGWQSGTITNVGTLENSQCLIQLAMSAVGGTDTMLMLILTVDFKPEFAGDKSIFMNAAGLSGATSGWQQRGTWTVP